APGFLCQLFLFAHGRCFPALVSPESGGPSAPARRAGPRYSVCQSALLAQLVEHLHGKEGVDGSSPSEGSAKAPHVGAFAFRTTCSSSNVRWVWSRLWSFRARDSTSSAQKKRLALALPIA